MSNKNERENLSLKRRLYRKLCNAFMTVLPDKMYLKMLYQVRLGQKLDVSNPKTFNEKLNWLKLYDRKPIYTTMADKYEVRKIISDVIGKDYLIPLLGVWDMPEQIDISQLPDQFVLKCTHDSGSVIICKDKATFNFDIAIMRLKKTFQTNYFFPSREWPYKNIQPRVIAEKYMVDESETELKDYKIYNFNGKPYLIQVDFGRFTKHERNLYTTDWTYIDEQIEYPQNPAVHIGKPKQLELMLELAGKLAAGIPSVRTDFYSINDKIYFGEITFYQEAGFARFSSEEYARKLGDLIVLE